VEANETLLQIGLQYCRLPTHTDTKETYSTLHIQPHRCTRVCVMCYFDSLLLPLQSLAHFLSTNHLSPSPHLSFLLLPSPSNPEVGSCTYRDFPFNSSHSRSPSVLNRYQILCDQHTQIRWFTTCYGRTRQLPTKKTTSKWTTAASVSRRAAADVSRRRKFPLLFLGVV